MIKFDKFTIKAQEAIGEAQQIATSYNHQEIKSEHLLLALINQKEGVIPSILQKLEVCLLYTSPSPRDKRQSRMPSSA